MKNKITFIIGGARSGKSTYALDCAQGEKAVTFIATAEALDKEMCSRILKHKKDRPSHWRTIEAPRDLYDACKQIDKESTMIIVDCLTLWISNLLMAKKKDAEIEQEIARVLAVLRRQKAGVLIVANETGLGIVPANALARRFRDVAGKINQRVAHEADDVIFMAAGLPMSLKPLKKAEAFEKASSRSTHPMARDVLRREQRKEQHEGNTKGH